ncbi:MAG: dienelactone hydrolase family protein [Alphaproteobacteria bacterium]|nr:dienelactone hydrolase family protein [Alphaproteobacteria bacterium]
MSDAPEEIAPRPLTGPGFGPPSGAEPEELCILLHGLGADGNDLIALAPLMAEVLPNARFIAPNAPEPCDMAPMGHQWFSLLDPAADVLEAGVRRAAADADAYIDEMLGGLGLGPERLILIGFSQGAMTALHLGLRRKFPPAAILSFSGALVAPEALAAEIRCRPPVCIIHGQADPLVPAMSATVAEGVLTAAGVPVESHLVEGLGHGIDDAALVLAAAFLRRVLGA